MSTWHVPDAVLERYAAADATLAAPELWSAETHLERCPGCRERLAEASEPRVGALVAAVHAGLDAALATAPARPRRRRAIAARLAGPRRPIGPLASPLLACLAALLAAALLDLAAGAGTPSVVVLVAPLLPLAGVAASWTRVIDPAYELVAATPAAGLTLLLRRTLVVLAVVVPCTLAAEALTGAPAAAAWLLPCLALTAAALALGAAMRLDRACWLLAGAWTAAVVVPALAAQAMPFVLDSGWLAAWAAVAVVAAAVIALRKEEYRWAPR